MYIAIRRKLSVVACSIACVAASAIAGCGANPIIGEWSGQVPGPKGNPVTLTCEFKSDGTATQTLDATGGTFHVDSTYTAKDGKIAETTTSATLNGQAMPHAAIGKTQSLSYKIDGNTLTIAQEGIPAETLTRVDK